MKIKGGFLCYAGENVSLTFLDFEPFELSFIRFLYVMFLMILFTTVIGFEFTLNWFILCLPVQLLGLITADGLSEFLIHLCPRRFVSFRPCVGLCTFDDILL